MGNVEWKSREKDGAILYYGPKPKVGPLVVMPAIAIKDGMLIVGSQMRSLRSYLKNPIPFEKSLANNPSFASNLKRSGSPSAFLHLGLKSNIAEAWKLARPWAIAGLDAKGFGEYELEELLPNPNAIANALVNPSFAFRVDDKGFEYFGQNDLIGGAAILSYFGRAADHFFQGFRPKIR